jgi:hypothetical protein
VARARRAITNSAFVVAILIACAANATDLGDRLATDDPRALDAAIGAIEHRGDADELYAAGRVCEDKLVDLDRALRLYDRVSREFPNASVALAADKRGAHLRALTGEGHAREAQDFAKLVAEAERTSAADVIRRGDALSHATWPGAPEATLWLAEWLRRDAIANARPTELDGADARFALLVATWPSSIEASRAASGRAGAAIDAHAWARAEQLIAALSVATPEDVAVRDDLQRALARGQFRARLFSAAWIALVVIVLALLASLGEAIARGGRPRLRPPIEIWFLGPVALVLAIASVTAHQAIAPAVLRIAVTGLALVWISGATLDVLRTRERAYRARSILHIALCLIGVLAVAYIALTGGGLLDMLAETARFGPE